MYTLPKNYTLTSVIRNISRKLSFIFFIDCSLRGEKIHTKTMKKLFYDTYILHTSS